MIGRRVKLEVPNSNVCSLDDVNDGTKDEGSGSQHWAGYSTGIWVGVYRVP